MNYKKGFLLVSFLLYLTLFSTVTFFMSHLITSLIIPSCISLRKTRSIIALHTATDFFVRDIKPVKEEVYTWKVMNPQELVWRKDDRDIGWCFVENHLERREGIYDGRWRDVKKSIVAKGLLNVVFTPESNGDRVVGINLVLTPLSIAHKPIVCHVAIKKSGKI